MRIQKLIIMNEKLCLSNEKIIKFNFVIINVIFILLLFIQIHLQVVSCHQNFSTIKLTGKFCRQISFEYLLFYLELFINHIFITKI